MKTICVIPARMASSRYPGKPLAQLLGLELVLHIYERCKLCRSLDNIVIATCDAEIRAVAEAHGADVIMTADTHIGCVDRTEEAVSLLNFDLADDDLILMVQGDEVLITPEMIENVISTYKQTKAPVVNLASRLKAKKDYEDTDIVKVAAAPDGKAMFFSRSPIPSTARMADQQQRLLQQTGIIGFAKNFLHIFGELKRTPLEEIECIDMLRVLENHYTIQIVITDELTIGVDTFADHQRAEKALRVDPVTMVYLNYQN